MPAQPAADRAAVPPEGSNIAERRMQARIGAHPLQSAQEVAPDGLIVGVFAGNARAQTEGLDFEPVAPLTYVNFPFFGVLPKWHGITSTKKVVSG